ncbi:MAG: hypothetical protein KDB73_03985 [Planctomycetes bacterium]|nr:hypothetical protein [Planctomycetota bacterium]
MWRIVASCLAVTLCAGLAQDSALADEAGGLPVDVAARILLEDDGPQQELVVQAMRDLEPGRLLEIHQAVRRLAPEVVHAAAQEPALPESAASDDTVLHLVSFDVWVIDADRKLLSGVGIEQGDLPADRPSPIENGNQVFYYIDPAEVAVILRVVERSEHVRLVKSARVSVRDGQKANVSILDAKSFVADARRVDAGSSGVLLRKVFQTVHEGTALALRPSLSADRRFITLDVSLLTSALVQRDVKRTIQLEGESSELDLPRTRLSHARSTLGMPEGGSVLVEQLDGPKDRSQLILVTARHVEATAGQLREANAR